MGLTEGCVRRGQFQGTKCSLAIRDLETVRDLTQPTLQFPINKEYAGGICVFTFSESLGDRQASFIERI